MYLKGPVNTAELQLQFSADAQLQHAKVLHSDVDIQDIANEVGNGHRPLTFAVGCVSLLARLLKFQAETLLNLSACI
jgi:hypothetical protein